jgi:hypothetical protein
MFLSQLSFPISSRLVFDETIARDWYDGVMSGWAMAARFDLAFRFDIVSWGPRQGTRVYAFSLLDSKDFKRIVGLLSTKEEPNWPIWFPKSLVGESEPDSSIDEVNSSLVRAKPPEFVIASDSMFETLFAAKLLDDRMRGLLPSQYEDDPSSDNFDKWKEFLALPT